MRKYMIEEVFQTIKGSINKQYFGNSKFYLMLL